MKWTMSIAFALAAVLAVYVMIFQFPEKKTIDDNKPSIEIPETPNDAATAEAVYRSNCMGCHGDQYQGKSGPALTGVGAKMSREAIYNKIVKGGGGMIPFEGKLPDEDIINLTNWLYTFK